MNIQPAQILAWVQVANILVPAGISTVQQIQEFMKSLHPGVSEADLNAILYLLIMGASRHLAIAKADATVD